MTREQTLQMIAATNCRIVEELLQPAKQAQAAVAPIANTLTNDQLKAWHRRQKGGPCKCGCTPTDINDFKWCSQIGKKFGGYWTCPCKWPVGGPGGFVETKETKTVRTRHPA